MKTILAATAIAVGLSAGQANATCTQLDAGGTWEFYADISTPLLPSDQALRCTMHVEKLSGTIAPKSPCASTAFFSGGVASSSEFGGGTILLKDADNCTFGISFQVDPTGRNLSVSVAHATMSLNKDVVAGLVSAAMGGSTFTMVKIR